MPRHRILCRGIASFIHHAHTHPSPRASNTAQARTNVVDDDLDMTISGVWMMRWHLVNHNTHTHAFVEAEGIDLSGSEDGVPASN